ncbi:MAG: hypothetical protein KGL74_05015 [Elusimicrobia bacterium]|nr:hypothetical protein [Elusimicrobiota bacterium]
MKKLSLILAAACLVAAAGCDNKETRSGNLSLSGSANVPLIDKSGTRAELTAGPTEITFQKGSQNGTIAIRVRQPNRPEVNIEAAVPGNASSGNFTLRGSEIGQPVDLVSARTYAVDGPNQRDTRWEDQGFETCLIEYTWDPCNESWTVSFRSAAGELGAFASRTETRCNERTSQVMCRSNNREPRIPDFPHGGPHGRHGFDLQSVDPQTLKFD